MLPDTPRKRALANLAGALSLAFSIGLICYSAHQLLWGFRSRQWLPTEAQVTSYQVQHSNKNVTADISYQYAVNGRKYTAQKFAFGESVPTATISSYTEGQSIVAFYNPKDPEMAVLVPGPTTAAASFGFAGLGTIIMLLLSLYFVRLLKAMSATATTIADRR